MGFSHVSQPKMRQMPWVFDGWYIFSSPKPIRFFVALMVYGMFLNEYPKHWPESVKMPVGARGFTALC